MTIHVKICGLTDAISVRAAVEHGAAFVGAVFFAKSPRNISIENAATLFHDVPKKVKKVAVLVDPTDEFLSALTASMSWDFLQLHGSESPQRAQQICQQFRVPIIKAIGVREPADLAQAKSYENSVDMLMFDAKPAPSAALPGGNGDAFDWAMLRGFTSPLPWFLSGGLRAENLQQAAAQSGARLLDVSSGVESSPGVKDPAKIAAFLKLAQQWRPE